MGNTMMMNDKVFVAKKKVSIISKVVDFGKFDSIMHVIDINDKKKRTKDGSLGNTTSNRKIARVDATNTNKLLPVRKVRIEPFVSNIPNAIVFQFL